MASIPVLKFALIGFGAIGQALASHLKAEVNLRLVQVIVSPASLEATQMICAHMAPYAKVLSDLNLDSGERPDFVVECAGHEAVASHVVAALGAGVPCIMASVGALHDTALLQRLDSASREGGTRLQLVAGAIGAIDALAAASVGGLDEVRYVGRKPPLSWKGTPAEQAFDLAHLKAPTTIFVGLARQAALEYPKNANVAATVSLAGIGLDRTQVQLVADPSVTSNVHTIMARGAFGRLELTMENLPLVSNPKTSALTVYSLVRAIKNRVGYVVF